MLKNNYSHNGPGSQSWKFTPKKTPDISHITGIKKQKLRFRLVYESINDLWLFIGMNDESFEYLLLNPLFYPWRSHESCTFRLARPWKKGQTNLYYSHGGEWL